MKTHPRGKSNFQIQMSKRQRTLQVDSEVLQVGNRWAIDKRR